MVRLACGELCVMGMKKINSIDYGGKVIGIGAVFLIVIPAALHFINKALGSSVIDVILYACIGIGIAIEAGFFILLLTELRQDRIINRYYQDNPASLKTPQQILDERRTRKRKS